MWRSSVFSARIRRLLAVCSIGVLSLPARIGGADVGFVVQAETKLTAFDAAAGDAFGRPVAIHGDAAIVGVPGDDDAGSASGSAYVFARDPGTGDWTLQAKLTASDAAQFDGFGVSVAIQGATALVGSEGDDSARGSVYVFERDAATGNWLQRAKLTASDGRSSDAFGSGVSIDGDTAIIGARLDVNDANTARSGSAYVFVRDPAVGTWSQQAKLVAAQEIHRAAFGISVSIDGDTALIGAVGENSFFPRPPRGAAYVFARDAATGTWSQRARLASPALDFRFGVSVVVRDDTALIGAPGDFGLHAGTAHVFRRDPAGQNWDHEATLSSPTGELYEDFGESVSLDGDLALAGARGGDVAVRDAGAAYLFGRDSAGAWTHALTLTPSDARRFANFGWAVSLSGQTALVGAPLDDDVCAGSSNCSRGSAYVFELAEVPLPTADAGPDQPAVECSEPGCARVSLDGSGSSDPDGGALTYQWTDASNVVLATGAVATVTLPLGEHTITLTVTNDNGASDSDQVSVTVVDTRAPEIAGAAASPDVLWPPNQKMVDVAVDVDVSDVCDASVVCRIVAVTDTEAGGGSDVELTGDLTLRLRADRPGNGARVYTLRVECVDDSANVAARNVVVVVPHDMGAASP